MYENEDFRNYDSYTSLMWIISRRNYEIGLFQEYFSQPLDYKELLDWVDERLDYIPKNDAFERTFYPREMRARKSGLNGNGETAFCT
jgi:hypothetical protein